MSMQGIRKAIPVIVLMVLVWSPALLTRLRAQAAAGGFPDLVAGLKATPGCLGVETARTSSGKQVIFAWFENKTAALKWYYSDMHQGVMRQLTPNSPPRAPMPDVPDDGTPILAVASLTMAPPGGDSPSPFRQIAIELYRPLPGGVAVGGRFAPASLNVPGLRDVAVSSPAAPPSR